MFTVNAEFRIKWETGYNFCWESLFGKIVLMLCCVVSKAKVVRRKIAIVASEKARLAMFWSTAAWSPVYWLFMWEFIMCFLGSDAIWTFPYNIYFLASQSRNCCGEESRWHSVMVEQLLLLEGGSASDFLSNLFFLWKFQTSKLWREPTIVLSPKQNKWKLKREPAMYFLPKKTRER